VSTPSTARDEIRRRVLAEAYRFALSVARRETATDPAEKAGGVSVAGDTMEDRP
jgi:hypothetical protein